MKLNYSASIPLWEDGAPNEKDLEESYDDIHDERIWKVGEPRMLYYPAAFPSLTSVLICPGGAYRKLNPIYEGEKIAEQFNDLGMDAYVLISRLPNQDNLLVRHEAPIQDAQMAVKLIRQRSGNKVIGLGISAGGHLVSTLTFYRDVTGVDDGVSFTPDILVMVSPATILDKHSKYANQYCINNFGIQLSTYRHITYNHPPTFLAHAVDDQTVSVMHSIYYAMELAKYNVKFEMHIPSTGGHGICHLLEDWINKLQTFINETESKHPVL